MCSTPQRVRRSLALALLTVLVSQFALAGPLDEAKAKKHLQAIAQGDLDAVMQGYAKDAYMDWVGGPLDGRYRGTAAIRRVWTRFFAANGNQPREAEFSELEAYSNPAGASLEASASYSGKSPVKVWHVLTYRDGVLTTELWQIAPQLSVKP